MKIFTKSNELTDFVLRQKAEGQTIGFVPTMGALHAGHASLVKQSLQESDLTIVSIFVNPTQFNNSSDFDKYPIKTEEDIQLLENIHCDVLFLPTFEEIYTPTYKSPSVDLGELDLIMEAKYRPGHFAGVMEVVYRFFEIIQPNKAYFGLKDFQQVAVIQKMTKLLHLNIEIIPCVTVREEDGLAMSSRNLRLSTAQRFEALFIYQTLILAKNLAEKLSPKELKLQLENLYQESSLKLEYVELIDAQNFESLSDSWTKDSIICIVAYVGEIRLIDNMRL